MAHKDFAGVLEKFGIGGDRLLGAGAESRVYALSDDSCCACTVVTPAAPSRNARRSWRRSRATPCRSPSLISSERARLEEPPTPSSAVCPVARSMPRSRTCAATHARTRGATTSMLRRRSRASRSRAMRSVKLSAGARRHYVTHLDRLSPGWHRPRVAGIGRQPRARCPSLRRCRRTCPPEHRRAGRACEARPRPRRLLSAERHGR